ncbi:MAG TPA: 2-hydroxyacid dehydrogenase [Hyphomicrobiaceae bacterium]
MLTDSLRPAEQRERALRLTEPLRVHWETSGDATRLSDALRDADFLVTENEIPITREILAGAERLRLIQINGHRCLSVDLEAARALGVAVGTLPLVTSQSVAEHTLALIFALARRILPSDRVVRAGSPASAHEPVTVVPGRSFYNWPGLGGQRLLGGTTLSILGLGDIGVGVAMRAKALGMEVCYWQRYRISAAEEAALGLRYVDFEEAFAVADWLSVHVRFTDETVGLIGEKELALLRPTAFLINTARGPIVDENALVTALRDGRLAGASLDVYWVEPPPANHALHELENVVLTPHCAAGDFETALLEVKAVFDELRDVWQGHPPSYPVTA